MLANYVVAFTGHRPDKLGGYLPNPTRAAVQVALLARLKRLRGEYPGLTCISGMALGFDQWAAQACVLLKIPFEAAIPFVGQESRWPEASKAMYLELVAAASKVVVISPGGFSSRKMQKRNEYMVDRCSHLVQAWDGSPGGTANCIRYAERVGRSRENILQSEVFKMLRQMRKF